MSNAVSEPADDSLMVNRVVVWTQCLRRRQGLAGPGPPFALSIIGTLGLAGEVGALALGARRQGAPRREWVLIGLAAVLLLPWLSQVQTTDQHP